MAAPRALQLGLRRAGATPAQFTRQIIQRRMAATQTMSEATASSEILAKQRLHRPVSPHLTIFKPNIAMYGSAFNRITGCLVSGGLYLFSISYLAAPYIGWHLETPSMVAAVASWPVVVKVMGKLAISFPFFFHSFNGLRHLVWDLGRGFANKTVARSGWAVVGLSVVSSAVVSLM